ALAATTSEIGRAWLSVKLSRYYQTLGQYQQALETAQGAHECFERSNDDRGQAEALARLGRCHLKLANLSEAAECARDGLAHYRALGDKLGQAHLLVDRANAAISQGEFDTARSALDAAYRITVEGHHLQAQVRAIYTFGFAAFRQDFHGQAELFLQHAREQASRIADRNLELLSLESLGVIAGIEHRLDEAIAVQGRVIEMRRAAEETDLHNALNGLGTAYQEAGRYDDAIRCYREALALPRQDDFRAGVTQCTLSSAYLERGEYDEARACLEAAQRRFRDLEDQWWRIRLELFYGLLCQRTHALAEAIDCYERARAQAHAHGNHHLEWEAHSRLLDAYAQLGEPAPMRTYLERAEDLTEAFADEPRAFHCWALHRAFRVLGDSTKAGRYLELAYRDLMDHADRITDDALRHSFLNNVPLHARIRAAYEGDEPNDP
ncbi:MAG: tetratricopeptide repeat protein, partial [Salinibacter sp.]